MFARKRYNSLLVSVLYDETTLYFETNQEDELRKSGFSKDRQHHQSQIALGLLISENGYPLDYDIFEGNKYEGDTFIPVIQHFKAKYYSEKLAVIADAGLLSAKNITLLKNQKYQYILGARIKNESASIINQY